MSPRIPYGHEIHLSAVFPAACRDCGAVPHALHLPLCCVEACPRCLHGQKLTCEMEGCQPCECVNGEFPS